MTHVVALDGLHDRITDARAVATAGYDDGQFSAEVTELFDEQLAALIAT